MQYKGFWISIIIAIVFYFGGLPWVRDLTAFFLPLALWLVCFANAWWESKVLGWAAFSISFVIWMTILSAFAMSWRMMRHFEGWFFVRALTMYGALALSSLYPLKGVKKSEQQPSV